MEIFLLLVLGGVVIWLLIKRSVDHEQTRSLYDQIGHLEVRIQHLEKSRQALTPATPEPARQAQPLPSSAPDPSATRYDYIPDQGLIARAPQPVAQQPVAPTSPPPVVAPQFQQPNPRPAVPPPTPPPPKPSLSLEERLGANWLNKLGIVILVIGVAFFLALQLRTLGPLGKIIVGYTVAATLLIGGLFLERRPNYQIFARAGIGGGWALTFFVTYAMYHFPATQVLTSQTADLVLMMLVAAGMVWHSLFYKSQTVTGVAFLLAFGTVAISQVTVFSLVAGLLLAAGLVYVTSREHWYELELAGLIGIYLNHLIWLLHVLPDGGVPNHPFADFLPSAALILLYWLLFRLAYILRKPSNRREEILSSATAILNSAGMLGLLKYQSAHPEWTFRALLALGAAEMLFALYARPRRRTAFIVLSSIASIFLLAAIPFRFSGTNWSLLWLLEAEVLFLTGLRMKEPVFRRLGLVAGFVAALQLAINGVLPILILRQTQPDPSHHFAITVALACAALAYWLSAELAPRRWPEIIETELEATALRAMSILGLLAAMAALWITLPASLTVVAWLFLVLILGLASDRLASRDLPFQADALAAAALLRIGLINLFTTAHWGSLSQRSVTIAASAALLYLATQRKTGTTLLPAPNIAAAYSWAGSALLGLLVWYELQPIAVAVAWGVLGLILFELGLLLRRNYLRHQGYALLAASFIRIFFSNLNASDGHTRLYTVLPLVAAYFWVYSRLQSEPESTPKSGIDHTIANVAAWLGTIATVAVTYFEATPNWVAPSWSVLVLLLALVAWLLHRRIFLAQSLTLLIAVFARAAFFNLFSAPLPGAGFWTTRLITISLTSLILLLTLPIAFRLRQLERPSPDTWQAAILRRPEQPLFFAPLLLLTVLLAVELRAGVTTIAWSALGVLVFLFALLVRERSYRLAGLGLLLLGVAKILVVDIWNLNPTDRYITLIVMGAALLLVSFLYTRYREVILKYL